MPHIYWSTTMKKHLFLGLAFVAVLFAFVSCEMKSVMSPSIQQASEIIRTDTNGVCDTILLTDSLHVGDTVQFGLLLNGYYDYLRTFTVSADEANVAVSLIWNDEFKEALSQESDPGHGKLIFVPEKVYGCYTALQYIPLHSGTFRIDMTLVSAAEAPYTSQQLYFFIAVR